MKLLTQRDSLLVALRNLTTSVKTQHNLPEAIGWAEEAIANVMSAAALAKAASATPQASPQAPDVRGERK